MLSPRRLELQPSRRLQLMQIVLHAAASGGVFISSLPFWLQAVLQGGVVFSAIWQWRKEQGAQRLLWMRFGKPETTVCGLVTGDSFRIDILGSTVWRHMVVLRYRLADEAGEWGPTRARVLLADSFAGEGDFRQLRVWLSWRHAVD